MNSWWTFFLVVLCLMPLALISITAWFVFTRPKQIFEYFIVPEPEEVDQKIAQITAQNPELNQEELVEKIVEEQAVKCGMIGAVSNLASFITLPVTLAVDFVTALRIQARLIAYIGEIYGSGISDRETLSLQTTLVMMGNANLTQVGGRLFLQFAFQLLGPKLFFVTFPLLSGVAGYFVNYHVTKYTAKLAIKWYKKELTVGTMGGVLRQYAEFTLPIILEKTNQLKQTLLADLNQQGTSSLPKLLSLEDVASYLRIAEDEVVVLMTEGQLHYKEVGTHVLIPQMALIEFLNK